MSQAPRLARAGILTGLLAVIAVSCSSDIVELLPPLTGGASSGGAAGSAGQDTAGSGASPGGSGGGGRSAGGSAGSTSGQGGSGGAPQAGGGHGGAAGGGCFGFGCAGESGFGGSFGGPPCGYGNSCWKCDNNTQCPFDDEYCANNVCVQCTTEGPSQCWPGGNCDLLVHRCAPACDGAGECNDGRVCDLNQGTCVWCIDDGQCQQDGVPGDFCYLHRCVECTQNSDCNKQGERRLCAGTRCVQCLSNEDCPDGKSHCDAPKGYCE